MSARRTKTWNEKLHDSKGLPKVEPIPDNMTARWGAGTMLIPAPIEVDRLMRRVRAGRLTTIDEIRRKLAEKHNASVTCPLTTGIFAWIAAHAANEAEQQGSTNVTPYWRTLKSGGELNPKYPGGIDNVRARLEGEGHVVICRGKRWFVASCLEKNRTVKRTARKS